MAVVLAMLAVIGKLPQRAIAMDMPDVKAEFSMRLRSMVPDWRKE